MSGGCRISWWRRKPPSSIPLIRPSSTSRSQRRCRRQRVSPARSGTRLQLALRGTLLLQLPAAMPDSEELPLRLRLLLLCLLMAGRLPLMVAQAAMHPLQGLRVIRQRQLDMLQALPQAMLQAPPQAMVQALHQAMLLHLAAMDLHLASLRGLMHMVLRHQVQCRLVMHQLMQAAQQVPLLSPPQPLLCRASSERVERASALLCFIRKSL